ncbi:hypothetical protein D3C86_1379950 [compost metagenome]
MAGSLPVAMIDTLEIRPSTMVGLPVVNIRNRFWPEGASARLNSVSWLTLTKTLSVRSIGSSALAASGFDIASYWTVQILAPFTGLPVSSR